MNGPGRRPHWSRRIGHLLLVLAATAFLTIFLALPLWKPFGTVCAPIYQRLGSAKR
jgi:hypothetical protein